MPPAILPVIPENITVHLGAPGQNANNVTVPFVDYIKNVASSEIYPTWPQSALRANIYAIITYALNRIYTEWYPSQGYDYDITNDTRYDQAFVENRDIYENISNIVDEIFNDYVVKQGRIEPYFTQFCNGTTSTCPGLSQWGTVELAQSGVDALDILKNYYGNDIELVVNAPVQDVSGSFEGIPLRLGASGNSVKIIQTELNRISQNYPAITKIAVENGIFGVDTEQAVKDFQQIFNMPVTGVVDKATWYRIKRYYVGVKSLTELASEGISLAEAQIPFAKTLQEGMSGIDVRTLQYYLAIISYFNPQISGVPINGVFDAATAQAVREFQSFYGLEPTGIVTAPTWETLSRIYTETVSSLPEGYSGDQAQLYPGYFLTEGTQSDVVSRLQGYLDLLSNYYEEIPPVPQTGYFGSTTRQAVEAVQRIFGLPINGAVGPVTWYIIAREYDYFIAQQQNQ